MPCVRRDADPDPVLLECTDPTDAPGSCIRINLAKMLDHYAVLQRWRAYVKAACDLKSPADGP